jgi:Domain of unknown function (DUF4112)
MDAIHGEVVGRTRQERFRAVEARIARATRLLDELVPIPGTGQRFGLDPVIGLIPFVGDVTGALVGLWIIGEATRFGIPRIAVARMSANLLFDVAVGIIPFIGDLFDVVSHANSRNLAVFREHALDPDARTTGHMAFFAGICLVTIALLWLMLTLAARSIEWIVAALGI